MDRAGKGRGPGRSRGRAAHCHVCRGKIASFKLPRHVLFVDDYPLTSSGKVQKFVLRDRALAQLSARAATAPDPGERAG